MWYSRLFWKLLLVYASLNLASAMALVVVVSGWQEDQIVEEAQHRLQDTAIILRGYLERPGAPTAPAELEPIIKQLGEQTETRLTLVGADGEVLADSLEDPREMDNHRERPELVAARSSGIGISRRVSPSLHRPMLYVALTTEPAEGPVRFVRVALPMESIQQQVAAIRRVIWLVAGVVSLAGLVLTYWVVGRIIRPVSTLTEAAQTIAKGDYTHRVWVPNRDELGLLGEAFNQMCRELARRVEQLRETNDRLVTVLGSMAEGVIAVDDQQRILFANDAARGLLGLGTASSEGRPLLETIRNHKLHEAVSSALEADGSVRHDEIQTAGPAGRLAAVHASKLPGEPCPGVLLVLRDVTELRRLENLRQEFVANVSHELKTPLSSIKAYTETLLAGAINDPANNLTFLARIAEQSERLHQLILDLLSLARIESGQQAFELVPLALADVVESCIQDHVAAADAKEITLSSQPADEDLRVVADEEGLRQILDNLVNNAIKYTPEQGRVTLRWHRDDRWVAIEVEDTGIGIAQEERARVFERFYRVDKARSRELGGTGLGLSIVKHLTQAFGGSVGVRSELGRGSTFEVRLPLS